MSSAAITVSVRLEVWQATDWQKLWSTISEKQRPWRSIAIVPGGPGASAETCLQIAGALAQTGAAHMRTPVHVADATKIAPSQIGHFLDELRLHLGETGRIVVALSSLGENACSLTLAKAADCALLCVLLGQMSVPEAKKTVAQIGAPHFIGSAVFHLAHQVDIAR